MIQFNDLADEYLSINKEIDDAISRVINSGWYILGKELESFERAFSSYLNSNYCIGVASGTDAISLSLMALNIGRGDEVITTNITAFPTVTGILRAGATPVVVDILPQDGLINQDLIEKKINKRTKAIVPVHLYGQCCQMTKIVKIANKFNLKIIEDCAQSAGATFRGLKAGTIGDCGAFSFYPTKNIGAYGDGGAIVTKHRCVYEKILKMRNYGQTSRYYHNSIGLNSRLDEIQAATLNVKLKYLDIWNNKRKLIAKYYNESLINVVKLKTNSYGKAVYHLFIIKSSKRKYLQNHLKKNNIQSLIHYPVPINKQQAFAFQKKEILTNSEKFADEILSIPIHPFLKKNDLKKIVECINGFK